ncbi:MAG: hypothetical protein HeimC2_32680 [Candidatus Heimdallarchaeota archaeon LC_2]|nr:MAG: hypothetical protein HeimC2_32680 [Candidatus Heimdallarchaeota archaeon LC_2]
MILVTYLFHLQNKVLLQPNGQYKLIVDQLVDGGVQLK